MFSCEHPRTGFAAITFVHQVKIALELWFAFLDVGTEVVRVAGGEKLPAGRTDKLQNNKNG